MPEPLLHTVSILIKTFNRKKSLIRLLTSIASQYNTLSVLIADDSEQPYKEEILALFPSLPISYYCLPFDSGLSAGRNFLLAKMQTPYFLLCDDDFQLPASIQLERALSVLIKYNLDIGGGSFNNYIKPGNLRQLGKLLATRNTALHFLLSKPLITNYIGMFTTELGICRLSITNKFDGGEEYILCDCVNNFFLANTQKLIEMGGWDDKLKLGEHEDFFFRAKLNGLTTAFIPGFSINHYPSYKGRYIEFRQRASEYKKLFLKKFSLDSYMEIDIDANKVIFKHSFD